MAQEDSGGTIMGYLMGIVIGGWIVRKLWEPPKPPETDEEIQQWHIR
jgi:hypothetical protein